jgi:TetR/AcrR family transcriptional regulator, transcriptional repressor of aconitase
MAGKRLCSMRKTTNKQRMPGKDRKAAIVVAALPLFARKGFAETTTKDLARAAGVSEPLLYRHFPSKEALYLEIQDFICQKTDPVVKRLSDLEPSASTLVHLVYYLLRVLIIGRPLDEVELSMRHRLMLNSLLADGAFARLLYQSRFDCFCARIEACLDAAIAVGDAVQLPLSKGNRARFAHHIAAWIASVNLAEKPAIDYRVTREQLLAEAGSFALRGMGLTDKAIATYYNPKALALLFGDS